MLGGEIWHRHEQDRGVLKIGAGDNSRLKGWRLKRGNGVKGLRQSHPSWPTEKSISITKIIINDVWRSQFLVGEWKFPMRHAVRIRGLAVNLT
jgi:hypothetical protein